MADSQPLLGNRADDYGSTTAGEDGIIERIPTPLGAEEEEEGGEDIQDGVLRIEAVSRLWTKRGLMIAYLG